MPLIFKEMNKAHVKSAAQIEKECFSCPWSENAFYEELNNPISLTIVAVNFKKATNNENVLGFINVRIINDEVYINNIAVTKAFRRNGIGKGLLSALEEHVVKRNASFITLEVRESNTPAISLYSSLGYETAGKRKRFYRKPVEDAVLMTKNLNKLNKYKKEECSVKIGTEF